MSELDSVSKALQIWKQLLAAVGLGSWVASFVLWYHYAFTRPAVWRSKRGRIYPLNTHGTYVYLTSHEHFLLYVLIVIGITCSLLVIGIHYFDKWRVVQM